MSDYELSENTSEPQAPARVPLTLISGLAYTFPIWLPVVIYKAITKPYGPPAEHPPPEAAKAPEFLLPEPPKFLEPSEPPKERPFAGCCFVWIQDEQTGEVVAGISPKSIKSEVDAQNK
jgi:hypothetical protein